LTKKTEGQKSRATVPLSNSFFTKFKNASRSTVIQQNFLV
jgi:hypothetical protein